MDFPLPWSSSDKQLIRHSKMKYSEMETESAAAYVFESKLTCTHYTDSSQSFTSAEFVVESSSIPVASKNRRKWSKCVNDINYRIEQQLQLLTVS